MAKEYHEDECPNHSVMITYTSDTNTHETKLLSFMSRGADKNCPNCKRITTHYIAMKLREDGS